MQVLDDQGRVFGKVNIIDAAVLLVVCLLIPLAYGAYLLFRIPLPQIVAVEPARVQQGTTEVRVRGEHLRPYLRMTIGTEPGTLLFESPNAAVLQLPSVAPGSYDVVLYDEGQELTRLSHGLVIEAPPPLPRIVAVEPARVQQGTTEVRVRGEHLRPYLRMTIGTEPGTLLFESPNAAVLQLPSVAPGSYDVVLYDEAQELTRLSNGLVIEAPPPALPKGELVAVGAFVDLDAGDARRLWQNLQVLGRGALPRLEVVGFQAPERNLSALPVLDERYQVRAVLRLRCTVEQWECRVQNVPLIAGATVPVAIGRGTAYFRVEELHPHYTRSVELLMKSYVTPEEVALLERWQSGALESFPAREALGPALVGFEQISETPDKQAIIMVRLRVPAVETPNGWIHGRRLLRVGQAFDADRPSFYLLGRIVGITPSPE